MDEFNANVNEQVNFDDDFKICIDEELLSENLY
jgi:hypothetical protein